VPDAPAKARVAEKPGSARWCADVTTMPLPGAVVKGAVGGKPFVCDVVLWNSFSVTFKQNHKRYCKIVINMMKTQKPLCNIDFTSETNKQVQVYISSRNSNDEKLKVQHFCAKDNFGLKFVLFQENKNDTVPGLIILRLPDGSFVSGKFTALKAPRVIWDDEAVLP